LIAQILKEYDLFLDLLAFVHLVFFRLLRYWLSKYPW